MQLVKFQLFCVVEIQEFSHLKIFQLPMSINLVMGMDKI